MIWKMVETSKVWFSLLILELYLWSWCKLLLGEKRGFTCLMINLTTHGVSDALSNLSFRLIVCLSL